MKTPFVPNSKKANCNTGKNDLLDMMGETESFTLSESQQKMFNGFEYNSILGLNEKPTTVKVLPSTD